MDELIRDLGPVIDSFNLQPSVFLTLPDAIAVLISHRRCTCNSACKEIRVTKMGGTQDHEPGACTQEEEEDWRTRSKVFLASEKARNANLVEHSAKPKKNLERQDSYFHLVAMDGLLRQITNYGLERFVRKPENWASYCSALSSVLAL